ncbi:MFS transporter [Pseudonocardia nigra]|uniref:MFS transporter n=1 Tax=Pseudonocardia nigra TaxID=1921578 RepID=UPI001C5DB17A|nr:MFS transporter [Pseudonocardia nigra]
MRAIAVLTAGVVTVGAQAFVLAPLLADIAADLATGPAEIGRALSAYGAGIVASALVLGRRLDRLPRRTALTAGMAAIAVGAAWSAAATHWALLAAAQLVGGLGVGLVLPATYALAAELAAPGAEARATGRVLVGWSIALVAGVPLATVLGDAVGWRAAFGALAAVCAVQAVLYRLLPVGVPVHDSATLDVRGRGPLGVALRTPGVPRLLVGVLAFMTAFYGVYAFVGAEIRALHGGGATTAGLLALCYGAGFGLAAGADRLLDRFGTARLVAPALALLAVVYLALGATIGSVPAVLAAAFGWGLVNHAGLTLLVSRLAAAAPTARGAVLALNTAATYGGAAVAGVLAGPLYEQAGFGWLTVAAAAVVALAVPVTARVSERPPGTGGPTAGRARAAARSR